MSVAIKSDIIFCIFFLQFLYHHSLYLADDVKCRVVRINGGKEKVWYFFYEDGAIVAMIIL